jgi:hypothetical protein
MNPSDKTPFPIDAIFPFLRDGVRYSANPSANIYAFTSKGQYDSTTLLQVYGEGTHHRTGYHVELPLGPCGRGNDDNQLVKSLRDNLHDACQSYDADPDHWKYNLHAVDSLVIRSPSLMQGDYPAPLPENGVSSVWKRIGWGKRLALASLLAALTALIYALNP